MAGKSKEDKPRRNYRHPNALVGIKEPVKDGHNFADVDRALHRWLLKNDPDYKTGCIPSHYIDSPLF